MYLHRSHLFTDYSNVSWKRAQPAPLSLNKNSAGYRQPVGGAPAGRTDWAAKYVSRNLQLLHNHRYMFTH